MQRISALKVATQGLGHRPHDVSETPSPWGTRADELDALLTEAHKFGFVVLPVTAALERRHV
jgi:hypothetical protein